MRQPLRVGYLWQRELPERSQVTATRLHVQAVVAALRQRGHAVRLVTLRGGAPRFSDDLEGWQPLDGGRGEARGFRRVESVLRGAQRRLRLPYLNAFDSFRFSEACVACLRDRHVLYERYSLNHLGGAMTAWRLGLPLVLEVNGDEIEEYHQRGIRLSAPQWAAIRLLNRWVFGVAAHVVTVSEPLRQRTIARWQLPPGKVTAVPNGAEVEHFARPANAGALRARWGLNGQPVVMFVGTFKPWHGLELLLEAFRRTAAAHPTATLVLVGDGPLRARIEQQVAAWQLAGRVRFTGVVPHSEVAAFLQAADVAVLAPRLSGAAPYQSPLKLFEYMAAGRAIVAPTLPAIQGVLSHCETGVLVPPDDPAALAAALLDLLDDAPLRAALGRAAQQQALARHSWQHTAAQLETILYDVGLSNGQS